MADSLSVVVLAYMAGYLVDTGPAHPTLAYASSGAARIWHGQALMRASTLRAQWQPHRHHHGRGNWSVPSRAGRRSGADASSTPVAVELRKTCQKMSKFRNVCVK